MKITNAILIAYIIPVLLFFILCAAKFLRIRVLVAEPAQKKKIITYNLSKMYYTLSANKIKPTNNPIKIKKKIEIISPKLKLKRLRGKK